MEQRDQSKGERGFTRIAARMRFTMLTLFAIVGVLLAGLSMPIPADAAVVGGSVSNDSGATGRIYLQLRDSYGNANHGVSLPSAGGAFSISGVPDGVYTLSAFVDRTGTGMRHANDPFTVVTDITVSAGYAPSVGSIVILSASPVGLAAPLAPPVIFTASGGALVVLNNPTDADGSIIPDSYSLVCNGSPYSVPAGGNPFLFLSGLADNTTLSCTATPLINGSPDGTKVSPTASVTVGDCSTITGQSCAGRATVNGTVRFSGFTAPTGYTLYVALAEQFTNMFYIGEAAVTPGSSSASYAVQGVPPGYYRVYTVLDNGDRLLGAGDWRVDEKGGQAPYVVVDGSQNVVTARDVIKRDAKAYVSVATSHQRNSGNDYSLNFDISDNLKQVVNVTLSNSGGSSYFYEAVTLARGNGYHYSGLLSATRPNIGDSYTATLEYSDLSQESVTVAVNNVLDDFPKALFPNGNVSLANLAQPTLYWKAPGPLPGYFLTYQTWLGAANTSNDNELPGIFMYWPYTLTAPLEAGTQYGGNVTLRDPFGNETRSGYWFTPLALGPVISSITPTSGPSATTTVTVTGSGFTGASAVSFGGTPSSSLTVDSDSQITAMVPTGASFGPVMVTVNGTTTASTDSNLFVPTIGISGKITNTSNTGVAGATVHMIGTGVNATTASDGSYNLPATAGIPMYLRIAAAGYHDSSSAYFSANNDITGADYGMISDTDLTNWGFANVSDNSKGLIRTRVVDSTNPDNGTNGISGATVTVRSLLHPDLAGLYAVMYDDGSGNPSATATSTPANGRFYVVGIDEGDIVTVTALKDGWGFVPRGYEVHGGGVGQGVVKGAPMPTGVTLTPSSGGTVAPAQPITVSFGNGGSFCFTLDGKDPRFYGSCLGASGQTFTIASPGSTTVNYVLKNVQGVAGAIQTASYTVATTAPQPSITSFSPTSGPMDTTVTINGTGFGTSSTGGSVMFNGQPAVAVTSWSDTQIVAMVSSTSIGSGPITVTTPGGTATSSSYFTVTQPASVQITVISPQSGQAGTQVTINGSGFDPTPENNSVFFDTTSATISSATATELVVTVPVGATSGPISVESTNGYAVSSASFSVNPELVSTLAGSTGSGSFLCNGAACADSYPVDTVLEVQAVPDTGSAFTGWSGACSGSANPCTVTISGTTSVFATFRGDSTLGAVPAEGNLSITMEADGRIGIYRFNQGQWQQQVYAWRNKGSLLHISGASQALGYYYGNAGSLTHETAQRIDDTRYKSVWSTNVLNFDSSASSFATDETVTGETSGATGVVTGSTLSETSGSGSVGLRNVTGTWLPGENILSGTTVRALASGGLKSATVTQTVTYDPGSAYYNLQWDIANTGATDLSDIRFFHGQDTYFYGSDNGAGFWDGANNTVGVQKHVLVGETSALMRMSLQGITTPYAYESRYYGAVRDNVEVAALTNALDASENTDNGYALEWRLPTLSPGTAWTVVANEKFADVVVSGGVSVTAPVSASCAPGAPCPLNFNVTNTGTSQQTVSLSASSDQPAWTVALESASITVDAGASRQVTVTLTPESTATTGTIGHVTLVADSTASDTSTVTINPPLGAISGRVTNGTSGLFGIVVAAYDAGGNPVGGAITDNSGDYTVSNLAAGSYKVLFVAPGNAWKQQYYNNRADLASADPVTVTPPATTNLADVVMINAPTSIPSVEYPVDANTVALYHFNSADAGSTPDSVGNHDGTLLGNAQITAAGRFGGGLLLDGQGSYVRTGNIHQNPTRDYSKGTVEAWVKLSSTTDYMVILGSGDEYGSNYDDGWYLGRHPVAANNKLVFMVWSGGWKYADSGITPESLVGGWHHLAGTWGPKGIEIWVDGVLKGVNTYWTSQPSNTGYRTGLIGTDSWKWDVAGTIDEVRISDIQRDLSAIAPTPQIAVTPQSYDFGTVPVGGSAKWPVTITNSGSVDLILNAAPTISGADFTLETAGGANPCGSTYPKTLAPGAACTVSVTLAPTITGTKSATLSIFSNDQATPTTSISLSGTGISSTVSAGSVVINNFAAFTKSPNVTLTLAPVDSNVEQMQFSNDGANWSALEPLANAKAWTLSPGNGLKTVYARFRDNSGTLGTSFGASITLDSAHFFQYANAVTTYSSQWSSSGWNANQVLGPPNTDEYGDISTAWAPLPKNDSTEYIQVAFPTPVYADGVVIRETYGNGFVTRIDAIDLDDVPTTVWSSVDPSQPGTPVEFVASWTQTSYLVKGVKVYVNTDHDLNAWEEIDSIQLRGYNPAAAASTSISGTISYAGTKTGRIYILVSGNGKLYGTSIAGPGGYTVNGVPTGYYTVTAYMDNPVRGQRVQTSPAGISSVQVDGLPVTGIDIELDDPTPYPPYSWSPKVSIHPGDGSAMIGMGRDWNFDADPADSYDVYWSTSPTVGRNFFEGKLLDIPSGLDAPAFVTGLTNGASYYFVVIPKSGGLEGKPSPVIGPVAIAPGIGANTVSGTVDFGTVSVPSATPLYVAVAEEAHNGKVFFTSISNPVSPQSFSISGVPDGLYRVYAVLDANNDSLIGTGDIINNDDAAPWITLNGSGASNVNITLVQSNASPFVATHHRKNGTSETYSVEYGVHGGFRQPVAVQASGPSTGGPVDLGLKEGEFRMWDGMPAAPEIGGTYTFQVQYGDTEPETLSASISAVLNSFPTNPQVSGLESAAPIFSWGAPDSPPAGYHYELRVEDYYNKLVWEKNLPSSQLSAMYDGTQALWPGNTYRWSISVKDANGNSASVENSFTPIGGDISGTVTGAGAGIAGIYVNVHDAVTNDYVSGAITDASGNYTIQDLPAGNYKLYFADYGTGYISQWYNNKNSASAADVVTVTGGNVTSSIDAALTMGGTISGTVQDTSAAAISGVYVTAYDAVTNIYVNSASTDANGNYAIKGLPSGNYKVSFNDTMGSYSGIGTDYVTQWYNNKNNIATADTVAVTAGSETASINATLFLGGRISGTVTNASAAGISGAYVTAYDALTNSYVGSATTDESGKYTIQGLPAGDYKINFIANHNGYVSRWYADKGGIAAADTVAVTAGNETASINATLVLGGKITGTVKNGAGAGIGEIQVTAFDAASNLSIASVQTASNGTYTIGGLPTGSYKLRFNNPYNSTNGYVTTWNSNKPVIAVADPVVVTIGLTTSGIDAVLTVGGSISGQVTDSVTGAPIAGISVSAYNRSDESVATATSNASGNYTVKGLPSDDYKLRFQEQQSASSTSLPQGFVIQVYKVDGSTVYLSQGTPVTVTAPAAVSGINAQLVKSNGSISGTVTDLTAGTPVPYATVRVWDTQGGLIGFALTNLNGNYSVKGIPAGTTEVKVEFYKPVYYAGQWYNNKGDFTTALDVTVAADADTPGINAALGTGANVALSAVSKNYGSLDAGTSSARTYQVFNFGTNDLTIGTLTVSNTGFNLLNDSCSGKTLPPGGSCTARVAFAPATGGLHTATLNIPSNDQDTPVITVALKGTGVSTVSAATVTLGNLSLTYTGTPLGATVTTAPLNIPVTITYNGNPALPVAAGTYAVVATVNHPNYTGSASGQLVIGKAAATVTLTDLSHLYDGAAKGATATTAPNGLTVQITYNGNTALPVAVGSYNVVATVSDLNYQGSASGTLLINTADRVPPTVTRTEPGDREKNVAADATISVTFSEPVNPATISITLNNGISGTPTYDSAANTVTLRPSQPLGADADITVIVSATGADGNAMSPYTWRFRTASLTKGVECDSSGKVKTEVQLATTDGSAKLNIPAGTEMRDINGTLLAGTLTMKATPTQSTTDIPGLTSAVSDNGQQFGALGAAIDIVITSGTTLVSSLTQGAMNVNLKLAQGFASAGSKVSYYSNSGVGWKWEGNANVNQDGSVDMPVTHLSVWAVAKFLPTGKIANDNVSATTIVDALRALRIAVGLETPTANDLANGDVAPLVGGFRSPDGRINVGDAIVLLQRAVGDITSW